MEAINTQIDHVLKILESIEEGLLQEYRHNIDWIIIIVIAASVFLNILHHQLEKKRKKKKGKKKAHKKRLSPPVADTQKA
jgi:hypothetical protein